MPAIARPSPFDPTERAAVVAARIHHTRRRAVQAACAGLACGILLGIGLTLCGVWLAAF